MVKMINKNKKGFVYFIEIIFTVLIVLIIFSGFIESKQEVFEYKERQDLREMGLGVLWSFYDTSTISTNLLPNYTKEAFPNTIDLKMEIYNNSCYLIENNNYFAYSPSTDCGKINISTTNDIVSVYYTIADGNMLKSVKLYLWRKL